MDNQFIPPARHRNQSPRGFKLPQETFRLGEEPALKPPVHHKKIDSTELVVDDEQKKKNSRKLKPNAKIILVAICTVLVLVGIGTAAYIHDHKSSLVLQTSKINALYKPVSKTVASDLSGLQVDPSLNKLPVTAVMIENSLDARPQSGLSQAMVVFEAVAEGGVTRFMALFQDTSPSSIGPIRSARPYYVSWAMGFDAGYAHVGGSPDALADIQSWGTRDLNQFAYGSYYQRITSRQAPHNVYTSVSELNQLEYKLGYNNSTFSVWKRKVELPLKTPTATSISMSLSGPDYNPSYTYNAAGNDYERSEDGSAQIDALNNQQVAPKVVIAIVVPEVQGALDSSGAYYSDYNYIGSGAAYVFQDGGETTGTWTKSANDSNIEFTDQSGQPLPLNPGQVWITAITGNSALKYS